MKTQAIIGVLAGCVFMLACGEETTRSPLEPGMAASRAAGCYTVKFRVELTSADDVVFQGAVTGDLEGEAYATNTGFTWPPSGATNTSTFDFTWHISGGTVPDLIGRTFVTRSENRNILHFLLPPGHLRVRNVGTQRAEAGVATANLTYAGYTNVDAPPFVTRLDHNGVICP